MSRVRKGDTVSVLAGKDRGKSGKVLKVFPEKSIAVVEGINFIKKHVRKRREDEKGGIIQMEGPIHLSNLAIFCKGCKRAVRVKITALKDGTKSRICKKCSEMI